MVTLYTRSDYLQCTNEDLRLRKMEQTAPKSHSPQMRELRAKLMSPRSVPLSKCMATIFEPRPPVLE